MNEHDAQILSTKKGPFVEAMNPWIEHPAYRSDLHGGTQWVFIFKNGFGASVVNHSASYRSDLGDWELAVLDGEGSLTYDTPITDDVMVLSPDKVAETLRQIASLPTSPLAPITVARVGELNQWSSD